MGQHMKAQVNLGNDKNRLTLGGECKIIFQKKKIHTTKLGIELIGLMFFCLFFFFLLLSANCFWKTINNLSAMN